MFGTQNMAAQLMPQYPILYCPYYFHSCHYGIYSGGCGLVYYSCHFGYYSLTPTIAQGPVCPGGASIPAPVGPGDPVEALQALRRQLEVALAGVRAQEEALRQQRSAAGREGGQRSE
jgi:hypothetical protein